MKINCCWLYAISRYGYPPSMADTKRALKDMAAMGFKAGELEGVRERNLLEVYAARHELRDLCRAIGLKIINFCPVLPDLVNPDRRRRLEAVRLFAMGAELSAFFGAGLVQIDSFTPPVTFVGEKPYGDDVRFDRKFKVRIPRGFSWDRQWRALVDGVRRCKAIARRKGLALLMEPRVGEMVSNTEGMLRLADAVGRPGFGVVFDTGHLHAQKELLPLSAAKLGGLIKYVHASDNDGRTNAHGPIGRGAIDWPGLFGALRRTGFDGYVGVDVGKVADLKAAYVRSRGALARLARGGGWTKAKRRG